MSNDELQQQAREAAEGHYKECLTNGDHPVSAGAYSESFRDGYLAAATAREKGIAELRAEVNDWRESAAKAAGERCEDEIHCPCVPLLRVEISTLRAKLASIPLEEIQRSALALRQSECWDDQYSTSEANMAQQRANDDADTIDRWLAGLK